MMERRSAMETPRNLLISLLCRIRNGSEISIEEISTLYRGSRSLVRDQLKDLAERNLLLFDEAHGQILVNDRLKIAVEAIRAGADIERVSRLLTWQEFEEVAQKSLDNAGFATKKHVTFTWRRRRFEIDLLGIREPIIVSADCKHWRRNQTSRLRVAARNQFLRTNAFRHFLSKHARDFGTDNWQDIWLIPVVIELATQDAQFSEGVPVIPILKLHSFLEGVDPFIPGLSILKINPEE